MTIKSKYDSCEMCGAIMMPSPWGVCKDCVEEDQRQFDIVKKSLGMHEVKSIDEISQDTGIAAKHIRRWIKRGSFQAPTS